MHLWNRQENILTNCLHMYIKIYHWIQILTARIFQREDDVKLKLACTHTNVNGISKCNRTKSKSSVFRLVPAVGWIAAPPKDMPTWNLWLWPLFKKRVFADAIKYLEMRSILSLHVAFMLPNISSLKLCFGPLVIYRRNVSQVRCFSRTVYVLFLPASVWCVRRKWSSVTLGNNLYIVQPWKGTGHSVQGAWFQSIVHSAKAGKGHVLISLVVSVAKYGTISPTPLNPIKPLRLNRFVFR